MTDTTAQMTDDPPPTPYRSAVPPPGPQTLAGGSYSRFAHSMRIVLPLIAAAITVMVIAWPQVGEKPKEFSLGVSGVTTNDSGGQQIINARFTGTDKQHRPFTLTADTAAQVQKSPNLIDLSFPKADISLRSGAWLALSAETGLYDRRSQVLTVKGAVNLFHDTGYELHTSAARIDLGRGTASGDEPVSGQGPAGTLRSQGFRLFDHGKRLIFTGESQLILFPTAKEGKGKG